MEIRPGAGPASRVVVEYCACTDEPEIAARMQNAPAKLVSPHRPILPCLAEAFASLILIRMGHDRNAGNQPEPMRGDRETDQYNRANKTPAAWERRGMGGRTRVSLSSHLMTIGNAQPAIAGKCLM